VIPVGATVRLLEDIYEAPDDYSPDGYLARRGVELLVRASRTSWVSPFDYYVSHQHITDRTFGVKASEVELVRATTQTESEKP
jgi:hypothetical protein